MEAKELVRQLSAIAHPTRLRVFRLLVQVAPGGLASGDIARRLSIPPTTMSSHLAILARAGLIKAVRASRIVAYQLDPRAVRALIDALVSDCCGGRPDLCGPDLSCPSVEASQGKGCGG